MTIFIYQKTPLLYDSMVNPVDKFIATFESRNTNKSHRTHLNKFFELLGLSPESYFSSGRNYEDYLTTLWLSMKEYASGTRKIRMSVVYNFLLDNNANINPRLIKNLRGRTKTVEKVTDDIIPTKEELRQILSHGSVKERALFLICISSGMHQEI
jgi:hypothetical protein